MTTIPVFSRTHVEAAVSPERALEAGFNGYIEKPISVRAFPGQVRSFLSDGQVGTG